MKGYNIKYMRQYTKHIKAKTGLFDIDIKELLEYKDLIFLFFKRNYAARYKQTILGPLWLIFNPIITVSLYAIVFGKLAGLSTGGVPQFAFYLCSNAIWTFFATCITETANTFTANSAIMGKVYFPRLAMPISSVVTGMMDMFIQLVMLLLVMGVYMIVGVDFCWNMAIVTVPVLVIQTGMLGLGCGIIIAALTTKYRDLVVLVGFGVQLWMYASPVVYTTELVPDRYRSLYMINPMATIITCWRSAILGIGEFPILYWGISLLITISILFVGVVLFSKVEKTFMDTV